MVSVWSAGAGGVICRVLLMAVLILAGCGGGMVSRVPGSVPHRVSERERCPVVGVVVVELGTISVGTIIGSLAGNGVGDTIRVQIGSSDVTYEFVYDGTAQGDNVGVVYGFTMHDPAYALELAIVAVQGSLLSVDRVNSVLTLTPKSGSGLWVGLTDAAPALNPVGDSPRITTSLD
jgi:hypothetical protein